MTAKAMHKMSSRGTQAPRKHLLVSYALLKRSKIRTLLRCSPKQTAIRWTMRLESRLMECFFFQILNSLLLMVKIQDHTLTHGSRTMQPTQTGRLGTPIFTRQIPASGQSHHQANTTSGQQPSVQEAPLLRIIFSTKKVFLARATTQSIKSQILMTALKRQIVT